MLHNSELYARICNMLPAADQGMNCVEKVPGTTECCGRIPVMQGKQKTNGHYFASVVDKKADVRLYFLPIYTHAREFEGKFTHLRRMLKGKSCFHLKASRFDAESESELKQMIKLGLDLYRTGGLI